MADGNHDLSRSDNTGSLSSYVNEPSHLSVRPMLFIIKGEIMATPEAALRILNEVNKYYEKPAVAARLVEALKRADKNPEAYMLEVQCLHEVA
jgi:hypothetical protein